MEIKLDLTDFLKALENVQSSSMEELETSFQDLSNNIAQTTQEITPIHTGELRNSLEIETRINQDEFTTTIQFTAEHALKVHESDYQLGETSSSQSGVQSFSGNAYQVGNKFLERVLLGEQENLLKEYEKSLQRGIQKGART